MSETNLIILILGLASSATVILGLLFFEWYDRHQVAWEIRLQTAVRVAAGAAIMAVLS